MKGEGGASISRSAVSFRKRRQLLFEHEKTAIKGKALQERKKKWVEIGEKEGCQA